MNAGPCERVDKGSQSSSLSGEQDHDLFMRQLRRLINTIRRAARARAPTKRGGSKRDAACDCASSLD